MKIHIQRAALAAATVTVVSLLAEFLLALFFPVFHRHHAVRYDPGLYQADEELGWTLHPGHKGRYRYLGVYNCTLSVDARGCRTVPSSEMPADVAVFGDSFTFGLGVDDDRTYTALLGRELDVPVANAGAPAYGVTQSLDRARRLLPILKPRLVILQVFLCNDILDDIGNRFGGRLATMEVVDGRLLNKLEGDAGRNRGALKGLLYDRCNLWRLFRHGLEKIQSFSAPPPEWIEINARLYAVQPDDELLQPARAVMDVYSSFAALATEHGAEFLVVMIPWREEIDPVLWKAFVDAAGVPADSLDPHGPYRWVEKTLKAESIPYLDLTEAFKQHDPSVLYYPYDGHLTAFGNQVAATAIAKAARPFMQ